MPLTFLRGITFTWSNGPGCATENVAPAFWLAMAYWSSKNRLKRKESVVLVENGFLRAETLNEIVDGPTKAVWSLPGNRTVIVFLPLSVST